MDDGIDNLKEQITEITYYMDYFNFIHIVRLPSLLQPGMSNKSAVFEDEEKKLSQTQSKNKFQS